MVDYVFVKPVPRGMGRGTGHVVSMAEQIHNAQVQEGGNHNVDEMIHSILAPRNNQASDLQNYPEVQEADNRHVQENIHGRYTRDTQASGSRYAQVQETGNPAHPLNMGASMSAHSTTPRHSSIAGTIYTSGITTSANTGFALPQGSILAQQNNFHHINPTSLTLPLKTEHTSRWDSQLGGNGVMGYGNEMNHPMATHNYSNNGPSSVLARLGHNPSVPSTLSALAPAARPLRPDHQAFLNWTQGRQIYWNNQPAVVDNPSWWGLFGPESFVGGPADLVFEDGTKVDWDEVLDYIKAHAPGTITDPRIDVLDVPVPRESAIRSYGSITSYQQQQQYYGSGPAYPQQGGYTQSVPRGSSLVDYTKVGPSGFPPCKTYGHFWKPELDDILITRREAGDDWTTVRNEHFSQFPEINNTKLDRRHRTVIIFRAKYKEDKRQKELMERVAKSAHELC